jgi:hypothetical protein
MGGAVFTPKQQNWRVYADGAGPTAALANENVKPTLADSGIIRIRISINETGGKASNNATTILEYSLNQSDWFSLGAAAHWDHADGADADGSLISSRLLSDSGADGEYCESAISNVSYAASAITENDMAIVPTGNVSAETTYYFRTVIAGTAVPLNTSETYPQVLTAVAALPTREADLSVTLAGCVVAAAATLVATAALAVQLAGATVGSGATVPVVADLGKTLSGATLSADATVGGGPETLAFTVLTSLLTTSNPETTESISPAAGSVVYVAVCAAESNTASAGVLSVSGAGLSWVQIGAQHYGDRRRVFVWKGTGTPSSGELTITYTPTGGGTYQEMAYSVVEVTGADGTTPNDAAVSGAAASGTSLNLPDVGTPGAGDAVFSVFGMENASDGIALTADITQLTKIETGGNIRSFICGWDNDPADETPGITWTSSGAAGGIAFIVNAGTGGEEPDERLADLGIVLDGATASAGATAEIAVVLSRQLEDVSASSGATAPVVGESSVQLGDASVVSAGAAAADADLAVALGDASLSAAAGVASEADLSVDIAGASLASAATVPVVADAGISLASAALASGVTIPVEADAAVQLAGATLSATASGDASRTAELSVQLAGASVSSAGVADIEADAAVPLAGASLSSAATLPVVADSAVNLAGATLSATASTDDSRTADLSVSLEGASVASAGTVPVTAGLTGQLAGATVAAAGTVPVVAAADISQAGAGINAASAVAVVADSSIQLEGATLSATLAEFIVSTANLAVTLEDATVSSGATVPVTASMASQQGGTSLVASGNPDPAMATVVSVPRISFLLGPVVKPGFRLVRTVNYGLSLNRRITFPQVFNFRRKT